jgi:DNA modification methylase
VIHVGDALAVLRTMPDESVHCVVTSPPYWGLRDYGVVGQLGLEPTFQEYIAKMVEVFREVRRVLRSDGTCWLNIGDSYSAHAGQRKETDVAGLKQQSNVASIGAPSRCAIGLKPKDLCMIPHRLAIALQEDGWYVRMDIVWAKPNPMPESVTDRPTKAHEYVFLLAKSEKYFYDAEAIKEPASPDTNARYARGRSDNHKWADGGPGQQTIATNGPGSKFARVGKEGLNSRFHQDRDPDHPKERKTRKLAEAGSGIKNNSSFDAAMSVMPDTRNKRSVWTIATEPFPEAHFATFPQALVEPCIKAGCPAGGVVLDPFSGSGTVGVVAERFGRQFIGIELNPSYAAMAERRISNTMPLLKGVSA